MWRKSLIIILVAALSISLYFNATKTAWENEAIRIEEMFYLIEKEYLYNIDLTNCSYDILKALTKLEKPRPKNFACLDKYSGYFTPSETKLIEEEEKGRYGGIGLEIGEKENKVIVINVIENTPAEKAGVKKGDVILKVRQENETESASVKDNFDAVTKIRGQADTKVFITIERNGEIIELPTIIRDKIKLQTVKNKILRDNIGYIQLTEFNQATPRDFQKEIYSLRKSTGDTRVIIDVRNNPGGLLNSVLDILYYFNKNESDIMITIKYRETEETITIKDYSSDFNKTGIFFRKTPPGELNDSQVIILINNYSASSSEIFAGVMQEWGFTIIGETSFGKGVGQTVFPLKDSASLRLTTFEFLVGNNKKQINKVGVVPNVEIKWNGEKEDIQLQKAIETLTRSDS